ncbi:AAA family ATPase [Enhygromyxa salina]|uniref:AAA family ATPase n=1 Tax=Enhygromyxa salina TaxID=215803 RepID=UPI0011BA7161|nr:ATP-binding protein [Enhygromyxa salina]
MDHLLEVLKILDGAVNADHAKVASYAEQLALKLESGGDSRSAERVRRTVRGGRMTELSGARLNPSLPVDSESRLALADERHFKHDEICVFLDAATQTRVTDFVRYVGASARLLASGVGIAPSLLLHGPPGTGKTELAKYVSAQLSLPLLTARTDALVSSYLGSTSKNLRLLFEHAMGRPCVLFLDEFDAVAKLRDDQHELGELKRVVVTLLQNMDALDNKTVILAATNHEHLLDAAVWRRFAFRLKIGLPGPAIREQMFGHFLANHRPVKLAFDQLAVATEGLSGADIQELCNDARREAVLSDAEHVSVNGLLMRIARSRYPELESFPIRDQMVALRELNPKLFTIRRISELLGISTGKISTLLREEQ